MDTSALASALSATRWMALYDRGDPKVPPAQNLLPLVTLLEGADIPIVIRSQKKDTHTPKDLLLTHGQEIAGFLKGE
jgi:hypothetical protein